ncbi:GGT1-like protein [Mya arenaria]|uniref:GGT1-like protein n=1 Tax=Mya arenaria TaxID=6604 RepID=A0ABY7E8A2_MYAAR|nr:GGT1-like protein [Mya arenaria]
MALLSMCSPLMSPNAGWPDFGIDAYFDGIGEYVVVIGARCESVVSGCIGRESLVSDGVGRESIVSDVFDTGLFLPTSSSTDSTFCPASRVGGSSTDKICWVDLISTPRSPGFFVLLVFKQKFTRQLLQLLVFKQKFTRHLLQLLEFKQKFTQHLLQLLVFEQKFTWIYFSSFFFDGNLIKWVHAVFDPICNYAHLVGLHPNLQNKEKINEGGAGYCSYDDDELQAASRLRRKRQRLRACLWMSCGVFLIAMVGVAVFFLTNSAATKGGKGDNPTPEMGKYRHAAVASDVTQCSEKAGGNAVDAAVAALLCMGLADPQSMGIGGGFFMTIYNRTTGESHSIDARETAPIHATVDMYYGNASSSKGGLSIAVPGEIKGYKLAMDKFGSLPWKQVFTPAVTMATEGAIITSEDLLGYQPLFSTAYNMTLRNNKHTIFTPQTPSSGVILMFILALLDGYDFKPEDIQTTKGKILTYHRIIEAFKFAYAKRTDLADEMFVDSVKQLVANLTSPEYIDSIHKQIWDNQTHPFMYYGPTFYHDNKTSTAHLFGSEVFGNRTGIIWNDEMDDFATSDKPNDFGLYPSPANEITPGKRPLSSMCPAVLVDSNGEVSMVVGAAGGSRITTATAWVATRVLWLGESIKQSIDSPRIHHQLLPPEFSYEPGIEKAVIDGLVALGHNATQVSPGKSIVQGVTRGGDFLINLPN